MAKLKPEWKKTDIPKDTKIKLWRIMKDNPTYDTWRKGIARASYELDTEEVKNVPLSSDTYRALKYEVMHMPAEEVVSLPADLQAWVRQLRPELELKKHRLESRGVTYGQHHYDHWHRLGRLAEELSLGLGFSSRYIGKIVDSRFGGVMSGQWFLDGCEVSFSAQMNPLGGCLLEHLDSEFVKPRFSDELKEFQKIATDLVRDNEDRAWEKAGHHPLAESLRKKLWLVIERGTFKGTCDICRDWDCPLAF